MSTSTPSRILSKSKLMHAWRLSPDSTSKAGGPGVDGITAAQFATRLETNIASLAKTIRDRQYGPSKLRGVAIPKSASNEKRLICIPTIKDRIVQRALVKHFTAGKKLPIYNSSSYGFIEGRGTKAAITRALELRPQFGWCLKTDIESFFDRIPRGPLKEKVDRTLPHSSVAPLVKRFIDCEIRDESRLRPILKTRGIKPGVGLRQGMPLSPILANLILSPFDNDVQCVKMEMIRYADDILLFYETEQKAKDGLKFITDRLNRLGFSIPELSDRSKTRLIGPQQPVDFLGRQIVFLTSEQRFVSKISRAHIAKIRESLENQFNFETRSKEGSDFQETVVDLSRSVSAYFGAYRDAYNFPALQSELSSCTRKIMEGIYEDVFGRSILDNVTERGRNFLGIGSLDQVEASSDFDEMD
ncbi:RNA-directed DNA polymerase [Bradyrhizobium yuanmingense]